MAQDRGWKTRKRPQAACVSRLRDLVEFDDIPGEEIALALDRGDLRVLLPEQWKSGDYRVHESDWEAYLQVRRGIVGKGHLTPADSAGSRRVDDAISP